MSNSRFSSIITHNDFDGVISAALCSKAFSIQKIFFTGPANIIKAQTPVIATDIVCDLPHPIDCALWFDHHEGNLQDLKYRGIEKFKGSFSPERSAARVVLNYLKENLLDIPDHLVRSVEAADLIDSFSYRSVAEWRQETPAFIVDCAIKAEKSFNFQNKFLKRLTLLLVSYPLEDVCEDEEIFSEYENYKKEEITILSIIRKNSSFLPEDKDKKIIVIDLTSFSRRANIVKNLAMIDYPEAEAILLVQNQFSDNIKTNNLVFSLSLTIKSNLEEKNKSCGRIMQELNIGDGHPGAASGRLNCCSKEEMIKHKNEYLQKIFTIFIAQK